MWAHRIMLESKCHPSSIFVTLTYDQANLPLLDSVGAVSPVPTLRARSMVLFLKRLRKRISPERIRYFGVGEYGARTDRPHYHLALFGMQMCNNLRTRRDGISQRAAWEKCCPICKLIGETWGLGDIEVGELNSKSASYCAEYVVKKMTRDDDVRLNGREPEFARMSRRPGLGLIALGQVAAALPPGLLDVPSQLRVGNKLMPLGRYLRGYLRELYGRDRRAPDAVLEALAAELRPLQEIARNSSRSLSQIVAEDGSSRRASISAVNLIKTRRERI